MISILGENYYIDLKEIDSLVGIATSNEEGHVEKQTDVVKYDFVKLMIEVLLTEREEIDENLGIHSSKNLSLPFKFAFNTLLLNKILKKI
jgi:hypothetical protein